MSVVRATGVAASAAEEKRRWASKQSKQASKASHRPLRLWLGLLIALASPALAAGALTACQSGSAVARIDPLVATTEELSIAIEADVASLPTARERLAERMRLAEELIEARARAQGRFPRPGAPASEWQRYDDESAPLRAALIDEATPLSDLIELAREDAEAAYATPPSADELRIAREIERLYGTPAGVATEGAAR